jgi:ParB/RepB/Spo0J family partition protein
MVNAKDEKISKLTTRIPVKDCIPMPEVFRQNYNQYDWKNLKNAIENDGYDSAYPVRGIWHNRKFEVFDGAHRLQAVKEIGLMSKIPAIDETSFLTRAKAISIGIKVNQNRSAYNPMDLAFNIRDLGKELSKSERGNSVGRPIEYNRKAISDMLHFSESKITQFLQLTKLPKDVQRLIGDGSLKFGYARVLTRLLDTEHEETISELAHKCVEESWTRNALERIVESIIHNGSYTTNTVKCDVCNRVFPAESMHKTKACPECSKRIHNGDIEERANNEHRVKMQKYLKFNNFVEKHYGKGILPKNVQAKLDSLYFEWKGKAECREVMAIDRSGKKVRQK